MTLTPIGYLALRAFRQRRWLGFVVFSVNGIAAALVILFSLSRGAWLASVAALLVPACAWLSRKILICGGLMLALIGTGGILFLTQCTSTTALSPEGIFDRLSTMLKLEPHRRLWISSYRSFEKNPVFGSGLDTFPTAFPREQTPASSSAEWAGQPTRAHNEVLHILATQGLVGIGALMMLFVGLAVAAWRAWRRSDGLDPPLVVALVAGIVAFCIQDLFSFTVAGCGTLFITFSAQLGRFADPDAELEKNGVSHNSGWLAIGLVGAGILGAGVFWRNGQMSLLGVSPLLVPFCIGVVVVFSTLAWCTWRLSEPLGTANLAATAKWAVTPRSPWFERLIKLGIWGGVLSVLIGGVFPALRASARCRRGLERLAVDPDQALPDLERACILARWNDLYRQKLGIGYLTMARNANDEEKESQSLARARKALEHAVAMEPNRDSHRIWLGRVLIEQAHRGIVTRELVYVHLDGMLSLKSDNAPFYADACAAAMAFHDWQRAKHYAQEGCTLHAKFAPTRAQLGHIALREDRFADAVEELQTALALEWPTHGSEKFEASESLVTALLKLERYEAAFAAARSAACEAPDNAKVQFQFATVLQKLGKRAEAIEAYRRLVELQRRPEPRPSFLPFQSLGAVYE